MIKYLSCILFVFIFLNTLLLAFAFRDFSYPLLGMFLISFIGLPLVTYLFFNTEKKEALTSFEDSCDVVGKFSI
jgi:hypothetical protein